MVPLKLMLYNFMSYKSPEELDFTGLHVACLSGNNGHGKSALLDAMTWALWGWARGHRYGQGGNSADELIHQGQTDMEVVLEFLADGTKYRILRKHSKGSRGRGSTTLLDLQMDTGSEFLSVSEPSIIGTERRVQGIIRMDYETFLDSAFLLQGQADRFTTSKPSQRKETLAGILGLSLYEKLEDEAKFKVREYLLISREQESRLEQMGEEISKKAGFIAARNENQSTLKNLIPNLKEHTSALDTQRSNLRQLESRHEEGQRLIADQSRWIKELPILEYQKGSALQRIIKSRELVARENEILEKIRLLKESRTVLTRFEVSKSHQEILVKEKLSLEQIIGQQKVHLESQMLQRKQHLDRDLIPTIENRNEIDLALTTVGASLDSLSNEELNIQSLRNDLLSVITETERVNIESVQSFSEMQNLRRQLDILNEDQSECPICRTSLGHEKISKMKDEMTAQGKAHRKKYLNLEKRKNLLIKNKDNIEISLKQKEDAVSSEKRLLLAKQGFLLRQQEEAAAAEREVEALKLELGNMEENLKLGNFAEDLKNDLQGLEERIIALDYNPENHQKLELHIRFLEQFERELPELERARAQLPQDESDIVSLEQVTNERKSWLIETEKSIAAIQLEIESLPVIQDRFDRITGELQVLEEEHTKLQAELIFYKRRLDELNIVEKEKSELSKNLRRTRDQWKTYNLLATAFGKDGIQAFLIQEAIPELESEANSLLAQLTDNRLHLTLETQRHNRRGEAFETLEIKIGDETGIRNFQLFSGGEAFRISFALRIALAKLLASRSGAPLKTLFIDEGFGTQDADGRGLLIDSIRTIQDEFDLIVVITHIEELKDAFPVRIEVNKSEQSGSNFQLIWS